jgi:hypothetical protein
MEVNYIRPYLLGFRKRVQKYSTFPTEIQEYPYLPFNSFLVIYELIRMIGFLKRRIPVGMGPEKQKAPLMDRRALRYEFGYP